jgi:hypothetical protein
LILEKIGSGGMGVVYAAYDPELDRRIALKALHTASDPERDTAGRSRLIREAKAMARLSHPNVVTVYDVLAEEEKIYVAMELVEGVSLRTWLEKQPRPWQEVVSAFVQAGRGLAAAHDASMVHRDFKLDNVFVGNDGRVRVGDFGLARTASATRTIRRAKKDDLGPLVSREGMLAGTPAYMAPDQLRGDPADARSDQFSFCVALYEGLYDVSPFEAATLETLAESMEGERLAPPPASSPVPSWLRGIVARGLRARPEDRFPSMHELLAALETDPRRARVRRAWVVGAVALVLAGGGVVTQNRRAEMAVCRAAQRRVDAVWGDAQRHAVREAFVATSRPYAGDTFERASRVLDAYTLALGQRAVSVCEDREPSARQALQAERVACLDGRLDELRAFVAVLARPDGETVDRAVQGARTLPSLETSATTPPPSRSACTSRARCAPAGARRKRSRSRPRTSPTRSASRFDRCSPTRSSRSPSRRRTAPTRRTRRGPTTARASPPRPRAPRATPRSPGSARASARRRRETSRGPTSSSTTPRRGRRASPTTRRSARRCC